MIVSIVTSILMYSMLSFLLALILNYIVYKCHVNEKHFIKKIDSILPQSQCGQCDYPGCLAYAHAIFANNEKIDKCIPGGKEVFLKLQDLLNIDIEEYNLNSISIKKPISSIVTIDERNCVGCSKCLYICPVDAIVGSPNLIHTVLIDLCTGCNLCISVCPTDCIDIKSDVNEIDAFF